MPQFMDRFPRWTHRVLQRANVIVTPSTYLARAVEAHSLTATIIPNVIDLQAYSYRHRELLRPTFLWMRSFHSVYNPAMAVRALARIKRFFPEAHLIMAGQDKGLEKETRNLAAHLGVADAVSFAGFLDRTGKVSAGEAADICMNTSNTDNMPIALIEACAMGLPVVTTKVGGIPEIFTDNETALFVAPDDDEAMAGRILELLNAPEIAARLSRNGRDLAMKSAWDEVQVQWEALFNRLLQAQGS